MARFATNNLSYHSSETSMLVRLRWPLLKHRRNYLKLIMFYKILHGLVDASFTLTSLSTSTHGHSQRFVIPFARTETYLNSLIPPTINLWNLLPKSLVDLNDINHFKRDLSLHLLYIMSHDTVKLETLARKTLANPDLKNFGEINVGEMLTLKSASNYNYVEINFQWCRKLECMCSHVRHIIIIYGETQIKHACETDTL